MKTVVITGSAKGFGLALAKEFRKNDCNVVLTDVNEKSLKEAKKVLLELDSKGKIEAFKMDVTLQEDIINVLNLVLEKFQNIDIWINNAGVNQPDKPLWELSENEIDRLLDIDLKGTILCSNLVVPIMLKQNFGQIYNVEGHGSNDAKIMGLSLYGTAKRAITYYTEALAHECKSVNSNLLIGKITPGIMITGFITTAFSDGEKITLDEKTKKIYNILGDYPETIASYVVPRVLSNRKNNAKIVWLTNGRAFSRFLTASFRKRNFFSEDK